MSPEVIAYSIEQYLQELRLQAAVAEAFFHGRIAEGIEALLALPEEVRLKIDQLVWDASGGVAIDPTDEASSEIITAAILYSLEERMGVAQYS